MTLALAIVNLLNAAAPGIAQIILMIKQQDGTIAVLPVLDQADSQYEKNIQQVSEWLKAHQK